MADLRAELHDEIERMTEKELEGLKEFLDTYPDELGAYSRRIPYDDELPSEELLASLEESAEWRRNGGKCIPHDEVMRELGLE